MVHDLQRIADDDGVCGYCEGACERVAVERLEAFGGIPVSVFDRLIVTCRKCRRVSSSRLEQPLRGQLKRTPGVLWRVVLTWLWVAFALIGAFAGAEWAKRISRDKAMAPIVGDRWTIRTQEWTSLTGTTAFENSADYGVIKVVGFSNDDLLVGGCDSTSDSQSDVEKRCKRFRIVIFPVARADVPRMLETGAIKSVTREGETLLYTGLGAFAAYCLLLAFHGWWTRRYLARRSPAG